MTTASLLGFGLTVVAVVAFLVITWAQLRRVRDPTGPGPDRPAGQDEPAAAGRREGAQADGERDGAGDTGDPA